VLIPNVRRNFGIASQGIHDGALHRAPALTAAQRILLPLAVVGSAAARSCGRA
jgi:hypothetical protein